MSDMPEQIWVEPGGMWIDTFEDHSDFKYIRADLVPTWQPIETAPIDQVILVKIKWDTDPITATKCSASSGWIDFKGGPIQPSECLTHWIPLPQVPSEAI